MNAVSGVEGGAARLGVVPAADVAPILASVVDAGLPLSDILSQGYHPRRVDEDGGGISASFARGDHKYIQVLPGFVVVNRLTESEALSNYTLDRCT